MFNYRKSEELYLYSNIDIVIDMAIENKYNEILFKLKNKDITTKKNKINQSDKYRIIKNILF